MKALLSAPIIAGLVALGGAGTAVAAPIYDYAVTLSPENGSGVAGTANLVLNGTSLTVSVNASGLVPNQMHMSHIHGLLGAAAPSTSLAPPSADANGDGFVESTEGALYSGPPLFATPLSLAPVTYPIASAGGTVSYTQTYDITNAALYDPDRLGLTLTPSDILGTTGGNTTPLVDRIFELHGLNVPAGIDGTTGPAGTLVYDPEMPVAAGLITLVSQTTVPEPASFALLGAGLVGAAVFARRRPRATA